MLTFNDWRRVAAPQHDLYDHEALMSMARDRWSYQPVYAGGTRWMGVELIRGESRGNGIEPASLDDAKLLDVTIRLQRLWWGRQVFQLLDFFSPLVTGRPGRGCVSGHDKPSQGSRMGAYVTIDDPTGCAEGIVHEVAHQRLHCMGIDIDEHDGTLFENDFVPRFFSPIRRDCLRPLSALLHGVYAYTFVLEVDLAAEDGDEYLRFNLPKVRRGLEEIRKAAKPTSSGSRFLDGYFEWADGVVAIGEKRLRTAGLSEVMWEGAK